MNIGRGASKLGYKLMFWINGDVIFVTVKGPISLFGKGGVRVIFFGVAGGFDDAGVNDFAGLKFEALEGELAFEFLEALLVEIHGMEVGAEAGDGGVVREGSEAGRPRK